MLKSIKIYKKSIELLNYQINNNNTNENKKELLILYYKTQNFLSFTYSKTPPNEINLPNALKICNEEIDNLDKLINNEYKSDMDFTEILLSLKKQKAMVLGSLKEYNEAKILFKKILDDCIKNLGDDSKLTNETRNNYAWLLSKANKDDKDLYNKSINESINLLERVVDFRKKQFGENFQSTQNSIASLARNYYIIGNKQKAIDMLNNVYKYKLENFGSTHLSTLKTSYELANYLVENNNDNELEITKLYSDIINNTNDLRLKDDSINALVKYLSSL